MKVFYTASYYGKAKYQKFYNLILKAIEENNVELLSTEKGNYKDILNREKVTQKVDDPLKEHYEAVKRGILWADAVIMEISNEDFQLGHEATLAALNKIPVLCLSLTEDFSKKIDNRYFFGSQYSDFTVTKVVSDFLNKVKKEMLNIRFNCFLTTSQIKYLEAIAKENKVNMSEYLRELIEKDKEENLSGARTGI